MKTYEALFIFRNALNDEELDRALERAVGEITRAGGEIVSHRKLGRRTFARTMQKQDAGHYVRVRFQADPSKVNALRARYRFQEEIFRVQLTTSDGVVEPDTADAAAAEKGSEHGQPE